MATAVSSTAVAILNINIESLCTSIVLFVFLNSPFIWIRFHSSLNIPLIGKHDIFTTICRIINRRHTRKLYYLQIKIKNFFFTSDCIYNEQNAKKKQFWLYFSFFLLQVRRAYIRRLCELFITRYFLLKMLLIDLLSLEQTKVFF